MTKNPIPVYDLKTFTPAADAKGECLVEVFDGGRTSRAPFPHRHDFFEVLLLHQGSGTHTIDFRQYDIKPPCVFFLSPGQVHTLSPSADIAGYLFLFTAGFYLVDKPDQNRLFDLPFFYNLEGESRPLYLAAEAQLAPLRQLFEMAVREYEAAPADAAEVLRPALDLLLALCKRLYPAQPPELQKNKGKVLVKRFMQMVEEHYLHYKSVKDFAEHLAVTPNHLNETVKGCTGRTASDLIKDKVMLEIKRSLLYTDHTVSEIAYRFGFTDQSYFSKYFRGREGVSPQAYRERAIKSS
jgi:AraC-like DNA-binding protein/mannose-6-phosphate isomerase-like protein (cupin superfamily)